VRVEISRGALGQLANSVEAELQVRRRTELFVVLIVLIVLIVLSLGTMEEACEILLTLEDQHRLAVDEQTRHRYDQLRRVQRLDLEIEHAVVRQRVPRRGTIQARRDAKKRPMASRKIRSDTIAGA
jgi:hypothetical protein